MIVLLISLTVISVINAWNENALRKLVNNVTYITFSNWICHDCYKTLSFHYDSWVTSVTNCLGIPNATVEPVYANIIYYQDAHKGKLGQKPTVSIWSCSLKHGKRILVAVTQQLKLLFLRRKCKKKTSLSFLVLQMLIKVGLYAIFPTLKTDW